VLFIFPSSISTGSELIDLHSPGAVGASASKPSIRVIAASPELLYAATDTE
jgi:hypothetical protein